MLHHIHNVVLQWRWIMIDRNKSALLDRQLVQCGNTLPESKCIALIFGCVCKDIKNLP